VEAGRVLQKKTKGAKRSQEMHGHEVWVVRPRSPFVSFLAFCKNPRFVRARKGKFTVEAGRVLQKKTKGTKRSLEMHRA
jgi:hypothetical protein